MADHIVSLGAVDDGPSEAGGPGSLNAHLRLMTSQLDNIYNKPTASGTLSGASISVPNPLGVSGAVTANQGVGNGGSSPWSISGAVTVANGADITAGSTTDAAVTGDNAGTISAKLRGLSKILTDVWNASLHYLTVGGVSAAGSPPSGNPVSVAGFDGTNKQHLATDTGGRAVVTGAAAAGATVVGNPVLAAFQDINGKAQPLVGGAVSNNTLASTSVLAVNPYMYNGSGSLSPMTSAQADALNGLQFLGVVTYAPSGPSTSVDRVHMNSDVIDLASGARTTTQNIDITTYNGRALIVTLDLTAYSGTGGLTVSISHRDPASGKFVQLHANFTQIVATGTYTYIVGSGAVVVGGVTGVGANPIGRTVRVTVTVGDGSSQTYSLGHCVVCQ